MVEYWVSKAKMSVRSIEVQLDMPEGTLAKAKKGVRDLPTVWEDRFIEFCNSPKKDAAKIKKESDCELRLKAAQKENERLQKLVGALNTALESKQKIAEKEVVQAPSEPAKSTYFSTAPTQNTGFVNQITPQQQAQLAEKYKAMTGNFCTDEEWDAWRMMVNNDNRLTTRFKQMALSR